MVVPVAACEGGSVSYKPSGWIEGEAGNHGYPDWIEGHQIYTGNEADVKSQPQPTQGQPNSEGPDYENGSSDIEATTQGSGGEAHNKQPANLLPTQGQQNGEGPDYKNGPLSTKATTQEPEYEAESKKTANPLPTQGQQNTDRPGDENNQSSVAVQTSPEHNIKNGPIVSTSQSSNAPNPSKPLPLPQDQQLSSDALTMETSVVPAPRPDTPTSPSQLVPVHGHHPAISTTFATEVEVTKEAEASESTHSLSPLETGEVSSIPPTISSSEAYRHQIMYWSMMLVIVGVVLLL
ncbi:MUC1-Extracellular alpha-14-glucan glucosidase [Fusarium acutatum]|uniref:MUC1-Extracellular alpha-14-glucan glucosidase n=1 Tax=Fusarium acutatum TaxID=78861 RepID=A0A8H4J811_9HYPO|nr:MUC1-Extracellular alpha-14-glucan glucosidase [Fusarium acutatum]